MEYRDSDIWCWPQAHQFYYSCWMYLWMERGQQQLPSPVHKDKHTKHENDYGSRYEGIFPFYLSFLHIWSTFIPHIWLWWFLFSTTSPTSKWVEIGAQKELFIIKKYILKLARNRHVTWKKLPLSYFNGTPG